MIGYAQDEAMARASRQVARAQGDAAKCLSIKVFFDHDTFTVSCMVHDPASGRTPHASADQIIEYINSNNLKVMWLLETHAHADHLSAAPYLQAKLGGKIAIGEHIVAVQETFARLFLLTKNRKKRALEAGSSLPGTQRPPCNAIM